jgi:hypothetical protein
MKSLQIKCLILFVIFFFNNYIVSSQSLAPDTAASIAEKNAISYYNAVFAQQLHLYNGKEYIDYSRPFEDGQPYFLTSDWNIGTVNYSGNNYSDVSIKYDLVSDDVIILGSNKIFKIRLQKENVAHFSVGGHSFINLTHDSLGTTNMPEGYYDVLADGKIRLLARRTKLIQSMVKQAIEMRVFSKDFFYIKKNNSYFPIRTKKAFLEQFSDKRKEVQQYIKQNKLRFRKDAETTMIKVTQYYNQITRQ